MPVGAPRGNQNAVKPRIWAAAIERALDRRIPADKRIKGIDELADKLLEKAAAGDMTALQELGNRLDGKPHQTVDANHDGVLEVLVRKFGGPGEAENVQG